MAWRIADSVIKGTLSNREKDRVSGFLWLLGEDEPYTLDLEGNFLRDLAGCEITFTNPNPRKGDYEHFERNQSGVAGDMTASRKVFVFDVPMDQVMDISRDGREVPKRKANSLYLEWFSDHNGRIVIESVDFQISVSEPAWVMGPEEEVQQSEANRDAFRAWLEHLSEIEDDSEEDEERDYDHPLDEFEWEKLMKESDKKTERLGEVLEKYHGHPDCEKLIAREMGWTWVEEEIDAQERGIYEDDHEQDFFYDDDMEIEELMPDPLREGIDWVRDENGEIHHPLALRCMRFGLKVWHACDAAGLISEKESVVQNMVVQIQICSAKLAGALNSLGYDDDIDNGFVVAGLKRAINYLHTALNLAAQAEHQKSMDPTLLRGYIEEMFTIREDITELMRHYRSRIG